MVGCIDLHFPCRNYSPVMESKRIDFLRQTLLVGFCYINHVLKPRHLRLFFWRLTLHLEIEESRVGKAKEFLHMNYSQLNYLSKRPFFESGLFLALLAGGSDTC